MSAMRKRLHKSLKEGLDFGGLDLDTEDLVGALPDDHYDLHERARKRQRVETIATQYLKGRAPIILSARLRGPFNGKWNNPWGQKSGREANLITVNSKRVEDSHDLSREENGTRRRTRHQRKAELQTASQIKEDDPVEKGQEDIQLIQDSKAGKIRKIEQAAEGVEKDSGYRRTAITVTGLGADINVEPSAAEFFSANTKQPTSQNNGTKAQWLRRRPGGRRAHLGGPEELERSPSLSRRRTRPVEEKSDGELHIFPRRAPTSTHSTPGIPKAKTLDDSWRSSASGPKDISSPTKLFNVNSRSYNTTAERLEEQVEQGEKSCTTKNVIPPQDGTLSMEYNEQAEDGYTTVLNLYEASPLIVEGLCSAKKLAQIAIQQVISPAGHGHLPPSREAIRRSAERCAAGFNSSTLKSKRKRVSGSSSRNINVAKSSTDTVGPLSALASSASFTYRKLSDGRRATTGVAGKLKPRPVNFNSSPAVKDNISISRLSAEEENECITEKLADQGSGHQGQSRRSDIYDVPSSDPDTTEDESGGVQQECEGSNRQSLFSTQAAMMLAQMEFQEESMPSLTSETPRPLAHFNENAPTTAGGFEGPSPAITPISDFTAQLDKSHPSPDSILRPMSTQELFAAASPYAFSIKKSALPRRSNLRFAVVSSQEATVGIGSENGKKSPTPSAERIPLKDRNSHVAFRGMNGSVKGSQEPLGHPRLRSEKKVELPRVSLD